jgi:hypothetical protein
LVHFDWGAIFLKIGQTFENVLQMYNWPWENIGVLKSRPTCFTDYPCDLLIVIAKATFIENCIILISLKGIFNVVGCKVILGMTVVSPTWSQLIFMLQ